jgi:flagellar hook-basal body complex protein FliE
VQSLQKDTQDKVRSMMLGEGAELHDVMIAANKSDMAFSLMLEVRNKLVDAWDKLSRSVM